MICILSKQGTYDYNRSQSKLESALITQFTGIYSCTCNFSGYIIILAIETQTCTVCMYVCMCVNNHISNNVFFEWQFQIHFHVDFLKIN